MRLLFQRALASRISQVVALLACAAATVLAQRTVVENNGLAGRIETDFNAAERVTEMRTIGADGKLEQKVTYEYLPGYYGAQQTNTTYWPSGKARKVVRNTYDESSNFTGEFIQVLDESGNQIAGHKLTHDPWTGIYRCSEWNAAARNYKSIECPAGEEESGGAETVKKFTRNEVMRHLEAARKAAGQEEEGAARMQPLVQPVTTENTKEVGLVLPAQVRAGERVSGRVVENPDEYEGFPDVTMTRLVLPIDSRDASRLRGWVFETPGENQQRADGPITLVVPRVGSELQIVLRQAGDPARSVSRTVDFPQRLPKRLQLPKSFTAPALCLKGGLCVVSGRFSGDSRKTFAAVEERPATIIAETSDMAYISIPELTEPGARPIFIAEAAKVVVLPVVVSEFLIKNNQRELKEGQTLIVSPTLDGPEGIPDSQWRPAQFPATSPTQARQLIPGFELPQDNHEAGEKLESKENPRTSGKPGEILVVLQNVTPQQLSLRSSKNEMLVFHLSKEAFSRGAFKYALLVEAKTAGKVDVKGYVIPFLAPVAGQEFTPSSASGQNARPAPAERPPL